MPRAGARGPGTVNSFDPKTFLPKRKNTSRPGNRGHTTPESVGDKASGRQPVGGRASGIVGRRAAQAIKKNTTKQRPPDEISARCQARRRLNGRPGWRPLALSPADGTRNTTIASRQYAHRQQTIRPPPADNTTTTSKQYKHHQQTIQTPPVGDSSDHIDILFHGRPQRSK